MAALAGAPVDSPADEATREDWLEQLFEAIQNDDPPYLESLDDRWGELCTTLEIASLCYSALFSAGRHDQLIKLIGGDPRPMWRDLLWVGRVMVFRGEIDEAIEFMAKSVNAWTPMVGLARFAEGVLLDAGRRTEAYEKYALEANRATTYLATLRLIAGKYPEIDPDRVLTDLIATTPGEEGKWFATAKTLKRFELAMQLAWKSPCDPKTLIRAARDNIAKSPPFAGEVALAALHWICRGRGFGLTSLDVQTAYRIAQEAGDALGQADRVALRIQKTELLGHGNPYETGALLLAAIMASFVLAESVNGGAETWPTEEGVPVKQWYMRSTDPDGTQLRHCTAEYGIATNSERTIIILHGGWGAEHS